MQNKTSNFWLDDSLNYDVLTGEDLNTGKDYYKIASTLRAVSNFVNIVTGQSINVTYSTKDESYTDGEAVVLSSNIKDKDFDPTVGLALHEGSHIKLTDFSTLTRLINTPSKIIGESLIDLIKNKYYKEATDLSGEDQAIRYIQHKVKDLLNIVEDRRIDNFIYTTAPGYRGYYQAMYNKYFNSSIIDKGLQSKEKRTEDWDSYFFRICNITNPNRDLNALKGLKQIWKVLDLKHISRLKNTDEALDVAFKIFEIVESNIPQPIANTDKEDKKQQKAEDEDSNNNGKGKQLSSKQKEKLNKEINKQKQFTSGKIQKKTMSKSDKKKIVALKESGSELKSVGNGIKTNHWQKGGVGTDCLVVQKITTDIIDSNLYETINNWNKQTSEETVQAGLRLGTQLGRKLQVRNDETSLKFNRLRKGKIDKRMISSLGFGNTQIFEQVLTNRFNPVKLHISIDASGSMYGKKWRNSQTAAIAIAKAGSMVQNLDVVISYRSTENVGGRYIPAIFIAYDSTKDKISKIQKHFKYINCPGTTPEGLCFEAIQKQIVNSTQETDSYFINFSDGSPYFINKTIEYYGDEAYKHTKKQIDNMRARGIKVLSYYISAGDYESQAATFKSMYGKDSEQINTNQITQLARSLNNRFAIRD